MSALTAAHLDDYSFMVVEIADDDLHFAAVSQTGSVVDRGSLRAGP